jgi:hypothetical protein
VRSSISGLWLEVRRLPPEPVCVTLVAAAYGIHFLLSGYDSFYYDATEYWRLRDRFEHNGHFSLVAYDSPWRGYSLPLLNHVLQVLASAAGLTGVTIVKIFGAFLAATLGVVVLPRLARQLFPAASIGPLRVLALNALIFLYWRDHFDFPLSDFPSLLLVAIGILGLLRTTTSGYLVCGLCFGLAANMRPAYLPAAIAAVGMAGLLPLRRWNWRQRGAAATLVLAGALVVSLPQMLINHHQRGTWNPVSSKAREITLLQLWQGMRAQKYETYVGSVAGYPQPDVFYLDPATRHVLEQEHISPARRPYIGATYLEFPSYRKYVGMVVDHPGGMAAAYVRRLFNGLDVQYPTPYVRDLRDRSTFLSLLQYTLMFVAIARLAVVDARRALGRIRWAGVVLLLIPCATAVTGAVEPRFLLPLQALIYMLVCFGPATRASLLGEGVGRRVSLAVSYVAFVLVCLSLSSATLAQIEHPGPGLGLGDTERLAVSSDQERAVPDAAQHLRPPSLVGAEHPSLLARLGPR